MWALTTPVTSKSRWGKSVCSSLQFSRKPNKTNKGKRIPQIQTWFNQRDKSGAKSNPKSKDEI